MFLTLAALAAAAAIAVPTLYVLAHAAQGGADTWARLAGARLARLMWNTGALAVAVTAASAAVGTLLAFLVARTDLPGRRAFRWLLAMPLAFPPYVGALTYVIVFGPAGWVRRVAGAAPFPVYESLFSASLVLTLFCYPYVYLIAMSSLHRMSRSYEETALSCGLGYRRVMLKVVLPMLRPAIGAGALLVALYVVSDFGAVAMLRYDTFVRAIYYQIEGRFDRSGAAALSAVLIGVTVVLLEAERHGRKGRAYASGRGERRGGALVRLKGWRFPAAAFAGAVLGLSVALPLAVLGYWGWLGAGRGALSGRFWEYALNSMAVAGMAALLCMAFSIPVVYINSRYPSALSRLVSEVSFAGYALPGVIVALGTVFFFHRFVPWLYPTLAMVAFAHFARFLPQSLGAGEAALSHVPPSMDEAARSLGESPLRAMARVTFPLMAPGVLAGGALAFVSSLKELPATLLLRPAGFDTLSVRVWIEASEGFYDMAAPAALLIIAVAALPMRFLLDRYD